jgi:hypothetical protein
MESIDQLRARLGEGLVIPACPLALNARRELDEARQRGLLRYYLQAGAGGLAVGVHTTQFNIRDTGLFKPVLQLAALEARNAADVCILIGGVCGQTKQACAEATLLRDLGYSAGLLSLAALRKATDAELLQHLPRRGRHSAGGWILPPACCGWARVVLFVLAIVRGDPECCRDQDCPV